MINRVENTNIASKIADDDKQLVARLEDVDFFINGTQILKKISFSIRAGQIVGLLGPNGAGKTTTIRLMLGLLNRTGGSINLFGHEPGVLAARSHIGTLLQVGTSSVPERLQVKEHIDLFRSYYPNPMPMDEIIAAAQLEGLEKTRFASLSGGEKQRVLFALAICGNPDLLILDEPTASLDVETRRSMWKVINDLARRGKAILLTTHYLEEADALSDYIIVLKSGQIIAQGKPEDLKTGNGIRIISCEASVSSEIVQGLIGVQSITEKKGKLLISTTKPEDTIRELLNINNKLDITDVGFISLEDYFLSITKNN